MKTNKILREFSENLMKNPHYEVRTIGFILDDILRKAQEEDEAKAAKLYHDTRLDVL